MTFPKEILTPVFTLEGDRCALETAGALAAQFNGRGTALIVSIGLGSDFAEVPSPLSEVLADLVAGARSAAMREHDSIVRWIADSPHDFDVRRIGVEDALTRNAVIAHARMADLIVCARPDGHKRARAELVGDILFGSGRPLILLPPMPHKFCGFKRILVAWNATAEATRALIGALPLLAAADIVRVVTVDAKASHSGHGEAPGREVARYLARHGAEVEVDNLDGLGRTTAAALIDAARDFAADLIVMGGYGHSRAREFVLGGVSRDLIAANPVALLLAH